MRRLTVVALALTALGITEIAVMVLVARQIGVPPTLVLVLATSLLGSWLLRREGARAWRRFREAAATGRPPGGEASRGLVGLLAALLLAVPGFVTDVAGLLLLLPPARAGAARLAQRGAERRLSPAAAGDLFGPRRVRAQTGPREPYRTEQPQRPASDGEIVEGEIVE